MKNECKGDSMNTYKIRVEASGYSVFRNGEYVESFVSREGARAEIAARRAADRVRAQDKEAK